MGGQDNGAWLIKILVVRLLIVPVETGGSRREGISPDEGSGDRAVGGVQVLGNARGFSTCSDPEITTGTLDHRDGRC